MLGEMLGGLERELPVLLDEEPGPSEESSFSRAIREESETLRRQQADASDRQRRDAEVIQRLTQQCAEAQEATARAAKALEELSARQARGSRSPQSTPQSSSPCRSREQKKRSHERDQHDSREYFAPQNSQGPAHAVPHSQPAYAAQAWHCFQQPPLQHPVFPRRIARPACTPPAVHPPQTRWYICKGICVD